MEGTVAGCKVKMEKKQIEEIKKIVSAGRVLTDPSDLYSYSFDGSFGTYVPDVVVQAKNVQEIANLVKLANRDETNWKRFMVV